MDKEEDQKLAKKNKWYAGYIVAGLIWYFSQSFSKTTNDELIILIVAIVSGLIYHRFKVKIKIKNEFLRVVVTFFLIEIISGAIVGLLTNLI